MVKKWKELDEFPDYAVSNEGDIHNIKTGMPRRMSVNQQGIVKISMYKNGNELVTRSVAVLVASAFCEGQSLVFNAPIHLDGDKHNCKASNLMWRPRWFAVLYHRQFQSPEFHNSNVHILEENTGKEYYSIKEACMDLGQYHNYVYRSYIHDIEVPITGHRFSLYEEEEM